MPRSFLVPPSPVFRPSVIANPRSGCGNPFLPSKLPSLVFRNPLRDLKGAAAASLFAGIRRSSRSQMERAPTAARRVPSREDA